MVCPSRIRRYLRTVQTAVGSCLCLATLVGLSCVPASGQELASYKPAQTIQTPEILRSWGSNEMAPLMKEWEQAFTRYQPQVRFADTLKGTETAQAALFSHVADMALMSRPILPLERHVMFRREHHLPLEIMVATGSADAPDRSFALSVLVNKDNPLASVTLKQLDGIFGDRRTGAWDEQFIWHPEAGRSADLNIRTWGQLGLTGEWADKSIHLIGYPVTIYSPTSGPMLSFRKDVMQGGDIWNPELREFPDGQQIAEALSKDRYSIGYTCVCYKTDALKPLAIAKEQGSSPVQLTKANVANRSYPLDRSVYIYIDRSPGEPVDPRVKEFLTYVLSREGQEVVARASGYLPLTPKLAIEQRKKLQ
jgi:phosphate transport system substrate-binding protein